MPFLDDTADLHTEFCITLSLNILVAAINNDGHPTIPKPLSGTYPTPTSDDADDASLSQVLNAVTTVLVRRSEEVSAIACKPLPPANSMLTAEPNPYQIYALEPVTWLGSEASPNGSDCATSHDENEKPSDDDDGVQRLDGSECLSNIAIVANPDKKDRYFSNVTGPEQCMVVNVDVKSHMSKILDKSNHWEECLKIGNDDPLANHVATLEEFVNLRRELKDDRQKYRLLSRRFTEYIVTSSFQKMRRRVSHWASQGFIYYLGQVEEEKLKQAVTQPYTATGRRDHELVRAVAEKGDMIKHYIMDNCPAEEMVSELPNLVAACKDWVEQDPSGGDVQIYSQTTCFEFHQLVVATLLAYGKALDALYAARAEEEIRMVVPLARRVWHCATLLWRIAHSGILHHHLGVLNKKSWLIVPLYDEGNVQMFQQFTGFDHHAYQVNHPIANGRLGEVDDEEEEFLSMRTSSVDGAPIFRKWLHFQADYLEAVSILSNHVAILHTPIRINLLAVKHPHRDPPFCKGAKWVCTVKTLIDEWAPTLKNGECINADVVIDYLRGKIVAARQAKCFHTIFQRFSDETVSWGASVHCEAAMASLVNFIDHTVVEPIYYTSVGCSIKESNHSTIGVSTLCCPTCWELLDILRERATDFTVRGRYATLSQVQLPPWLPRDVLMAMLDRFKQHLLHQIIAMMRKRARKGRKKRKQGVSGGRWSRPAFDSLYSGGESDDAN